VRFVAEDEVEMERLTTMLGVGGADAEADDSTLRFELREAAKGGGGDLSRCEIGQ
jgi:hypothetical protein